VIKKFRLIFILIFFSSLFLTPYVNASLDGRTTRVLTISKDTEVKKDFYIGSGEEVEISGKVIGDVLVFGGQVLIDGVVDGDLLAFGGKVNVAGEVTQDIRVFGGEIRISGLTGKNITAVGGNIELSKLAQVGGGILALGGDVNISSFIPGDITVYSGNLTINSEIGGISEIYTGQLYLTDNAKIGRDFTYTSEEEVQISQNASISGRIVRKIPPLAIETGQKEIAEKISQFRNVFKIIHVISILILGILFLRLFPNYTSKVSELIDKKTFISIGMGFLTILVFPIVSLLLILTIVGIPFVLYILIVLVLLSYLSKIIISFWLGEKLLRGFFNRNKYASLFVGLLLLFLVGFVKILGPLTQLFVLTSGLGAQLIYLKELYNRGRRTSTV